MEPIQLFHRLNPFATHQPVLMEVFRRTSGPVLELGCGHFSTTLLHQLCEPSRRPLMTVESDASWLQPFHKKYHRDWHTFVHAVDWEAALNHPMILDTPWSVVFVDQNPIEARAMSVNLLKNKAEFLVLHDSEYYAKNKYFGKIIEEIEGPHNTGRRDYSDTFRYYKEFFPVPPWHNPFGPPTLVASNKHSCDFEVID